MVFDTVLFFVFQPKKQIESENMFRLHNAMWPGIIGKGDNAGQEPTLSLECMLDLTTAARGPNGEKFDGIDYFLFKPHTDPNASDDELKCIADLIASKGFTVGSLVAPVWPGTVGDSAMGDDTQQEKFLSAVQMACRVARVFNSHGVRKYGCIRIDSAEFGVAKWRENPKASTARIIDTFKKAAAIANDHGERLAAEGEICWAGMHSWRDMLDVLEGVGQPNVLGFQADLAHTYLYMIGCNAPEHALVSPGYTEAEFYAAYETMTNALRPWTIDFHVAQNDGTVHGAGTHDKTGKHCPPDDPAGRLDIVRCAGYWLKDAAARGVEHICWDGCMFPNALLQTPSMWDKVLQALVGVNRVHG
jgi:sugar phosphate isomerase/epimerase